MHTIESIFSSNYTNSKDCEIIAYVREKSRDAFPDPYKEEYYDESTILFIERFDVKCVRITKVEPSGNVYTSNVTLDDAESTFYKNEEAIDVIKLYLFAKKECEDKDHVVIRQKNHLVYW